MTVVLKLGGSVITDKSVRDSIDERGMETAASAIGDHAAGSSLVLVHGGGSVGHPRAAESGIDTETGTSDVTTACAIHQAMTRLNERFLQTLHEADVAAVPVRPLSMSHRNGELSIESGAVQTLLSEGFVPVLHGDVVATVGDGITVASGDELVRSLAVELDASRVGLCTDVPGVLDSDGRVIEHLDSAGALASHTDGASTDVTGGMQSKVEALLALERPASIFGLEALESFLAGDRPGTTVESR